MTPEQIDRLRELLAAQPPGRRVRFHPSYAPEAVGTERTEWDTSHDVSRIGPDGTRYRIATYRHADDAAFADEACNALPDMLDDLEAERTARLAAEEQWNVEIVRWEACYDGQRDRANAAEAALEAKNAEIARLRAYYKASEEIEAIGRAWKERKAEGGLLAGSNIFNMTDTLTAAETRLNIARVALEDTP